jgi:hypothetical protein
LRKRSFVPEHVPIRREEFDCYRTKQLLESPAASEPSTLLKI